MAGVWDGHSSSLCSEQGLSSPQGVGHRRSLATDPSPTRHGCCLSWQEVLRVAGARALEELGVLTSAIKEKNGLARRELL